jgi:hypothetical protein
MTGLLTGTTGLLSDGQWEPGRTQFAVATHLALAHVSGTWAHTAAGWTP